jgi:hypothetical protein
MIRQLHPFEDTRALYDGTPYQVLAQRDPITLRDGTTVHLHPVATKDQRLIFHRAAVTNAGQWHVSDLRHLCASIENDLLALPPQDHPGVVLYSLRISFSSSRALRDAIAAASTVVSVQAPDPASTLTEQLRKAA